VIAFSRDKCSWLVNTSQEGSGGQYDNRQQEGRHKDCHSWDFIQWCNYSVRITHWQKVQCHSLAVINNRRFHAICLLFRYFGTYKCQFVKVSHRHSCKLAVYSKRNLLYIRCCICFHFKISFFVTIIAFVYRHIRKAPVSFAVLFFSPD
jgi:hypothetical protein